MHKNYMLILSIDVGIKNLAVCISDISCNQHKILYWDIINLCNEVTHSCCHCSKEAKYCKDNLFYCNKHGKQTQYKIPEKAIKTVEKMKKKDLLTLCHSMNIELSSNTLRDLLIKNIREKYKKEYLEPIVKENASSFDLITLGRNLNNSFNKLFNKYNIDNTNLKHVIIENQIAPKANRMKSLQCMLTQYFITKDIKNIEYISAINKLTNFVDKPTEYSERKKLAIQVTTQLLSKYNTEWLKKLKESKKKDDLADCYLQMLWFIQKNTLCEINNI